MKNRLFILFFISSYVLMSCGKANYFPGGNVDSYIEYKDTFTRYTNLHLNLRGFDEYNSDDIGITDKYFKSAGLSRKLKNSMLGIRNDSTYVIYSLKSKDNSTSILATVCFTDKPYDEYEKEVLKSINKEIVSYRYKRFLLETKRKTLIHEYCFLKNQSSLYNIFDYYVQWSPTMVVRLVVCEKVSSEPHRYYNNHWAVERLLGQVNPTFEEPKDTTNKKKWMLDMD